MYFEIQEFFKKEVKVSIPFILRGLLLHLPPPQSVTLVTNQAMIKIWRPEIKHLFVFHVLVSMHV